MAQSQLYIDNILLLLFDTPNSPFSCSMGLLFRALFKEFTLCILNLWVYRRVCALGCSFGGMLCPVRGGRWEWRQGKGWGCVVGASSGEALAGRLSASSSPPTQGVFGAATAGMMLIFGAPLPALQARLERL